MIKIVREYLQLTQEQIAWYLILSKSMVKKIDLGQRELPAECKPAFAKLFQAIQDVQATGTTIKPLSAASNYKRQMKRTHSECRRILERRTDELKQMRAAYTDACYQLEIYQRLAQSLSPAKINDDKFRLKWVQGMIDESLQRLKETDPAAQDFLVAEIEGLKSQMAVLEGTALFKSMT